MPLAPLSAPRGMLALWCCGCASAVARSAAVCWADVLLLSSFASNFEREGRWRLCLGGSRPWGRSTTT